MTQDELERLTIADLIKSEAYRQRMTQMLDAAWKCEKERKKKGEPGRALVTKLREHGIMNGNHFADVFLAILDKQCNLSASLRMEIKDVGSSIARVILGEWQEQAKKEATANPSNS